MRKLIKWKIKKENIERYDRTARIYNNQYRDEQIRKFKATLEIISNLKNDYVLDLGSGTGLLMKVTDSIDNIIHIDFSKNMLKQAKRRRRDKQVLVCADADHLPFIEQTFDKIFSFTMIQNIPDPKQTILEMLRVAKKSSEIILSTTKKAFTKDSFLNLVDVKDLIVIKFIDDKELKDYILFCKPFIK